MTAPEAGEADRQPPQADIDIEELAELVYRLMQAEIRLGRARGEPW